jgi:hypothetical protein
VSFLFTKYFLSEQTSYDGDVVYFNPETGLYSVIFEDGRRVDYEEKELERIMKFAKYTKPRQEEKTKQQHKVATAPSPKKMEEQKQDRKMTTVQSPQKDKSQKHKITAVAQYRNGTIIKKVHILLFFPPRT